MADFVFTNAKVTVNSVDLSDHVRAVTINYEAEIVDDTNMGDTSRNKLPGLLNWTVEIEWSQDYASSKVDATLFSLVGAAAFPISVVPVNTTVAATNPNFNGNCLLASYSPVTGSVGELAIAPTTFEGTGTLSRSTS